MTTGLSQLEEINRIEPRVRVAENLIEVFVTTWNKEKVDLAYWEKDQMAYYCESIVYSKPYQISDWIVLRKKWTTESRLAAVKFLNLIVRYYPWSARSGQGKLSNWLTKHCNQHAFYCILAGSLASPSDTVHILNLCSKNITLGLFLYNFRLQLPSLILYKWAGSCRHGNRFCDISQMTLHVVTLDSGKKSLKSQ